MQNDLKSIDVENQSALIDFIDWHRDYVKDKKLDYNQAVMDAKFAKTPSEIQTIWRQVDCWIDWK